MSDFRDEWDRWHYDVESRRRSPHGFLAVTGIHWLTPTPTPIGDAPGQWFVGDEGPEVLLGEGERLNVRGTESGGRVVFGDFDEHHPVRTTWGATEIEIARRGSSYIVRPRRPDFHVREDYEGTPTYPPDLHWVVTSRFLPHPEPISIDVGTTIDGLSNTYESPGVVTFEVGGDTFVLTAFSEDDELLFLFADRTSGVTTYGAGRELEAHLPDSGGLVVLDFNRARNLPCAYTPFATCPLPPPQNRLSLAIEAGERAPFGH
ncbi:MAG: DUF1684 domain-containing protein [Acidimicrobiales bacterium]